MRRKILLLVGLAVLSLGTMVFGLVTSGAWFTDSFTGAGTILTSGSLDLHVTGGPLRATNLKPDKNYTQLGLFCVMNKGTTSLKYRGRFESTVPLSNDLLKYVTLKVERHTTGHWETLQEIPGSAPVETDSLLYFFKFPGQGSDVVHHDIVSRTLEQKGKDCYRLSVVLDPSTPNSEQGKAIHFVLHVEATQESNPSWD